MSINFLKHATFLIYLLRYLYNNLSGSRINELLHLAIIALVNSSSEKELHFINGLFAIS